MIAKISRTFSNKNLLIDAVLLCIVYFIPVISHFSPVPIYLFDPMRFVLLAGLLLTRNNANVFFLAITIPVFSSFLVGHPTFIKAILISVELTINILLFIRFSNRSNLHAVVALFLSIILSKMVYYFLKFILIKFGILDGILFSTSLYVQFGVVLLITFIFSAIWSMSRIKKAKSE